MKALTLKKRSSMKQRFAGLKQKIDARLNTTSITELTVDITAYLFILLYLYTAYEKIRNHQKFESTVSRSELVGAYSAFISWAVPAIEIAIGALLILPWYKIRRVALWTAAILMTLFILYIAYMLAFVPPKDRSCECGGVVSRMSWPVHLLFNTFYVLIGIDAIRTQRIINYNKQ